MRRRSDKVQDKPALSAGRPLGAREPAPTDGNGRGRERPEASTGASWPLLRSPMFVGGAAHAEPSETLVRKLVVGAAGDWGTFLRRR